MQDRVLAIIAARPGVRLAEIRAELHDCKGFSVIAALRRLAAAGRIKRVAWGCYQLARQPERPKPRASTPIAQPPLARLMAGR
jgi:hypothetical protein